VLAHYQDIYAQDDLPVVKHFSPARTFDLPGRLDEMLASLQQRGLVAMSDGRYRTTREGEELVRKSMRRWRYFTTHAGR
jgi:hypothetical protein